MNKEKYFLLCDQYIDAETDGAEDYLEAAIRNIKTIYKKLNKEERGIFTKCLQIRGLRCTYCYNIFKLFYIDEEDQ